MFNGKPSVGHMCSSTNIHLLIKSLCQVGNWLENLGQFFCKASQLWVAFYVVDSFSVRVQSLGRVGLDSAESVSIRQWPFQEHDVSQLLGRDLVDSGLTRPKLGRIGWFTILESMSSQGWVNGRAWHRETEREREEELESRSSQPRSRLL